ncbi:hypothetical protein [Candidatus Caldatribacterium sp.]|uniref:hypothetical protein n=1 Tax=Candidatus Caldatribacterium sp. TaxID=2282143 RepID=UPI00384A0646|nr:hypothetical protein [Candidatus Caldatribacterium sp.]
MLEKVIAVVGLIVAAVRAISELVKIFEVPGNGQTKKEGVLQVLGVIYDELAKITELPITKERFLAIASALIDIIVSIFNALGIFRKSPTT